MINVNVWELWIAYYVIGCIGTLVLTLGVVVVLWFTRNK